MSYAGNAPAAEVSGDMVTLSWAASTLSNGAAVTGYSVKRYDASGATQQTIVSGTCASVVTGTSCSETAVPAGDWSYSVTPVHGGWAGAESPRTPVTVVDVTPPPTPTITSAPSDLTTSTSASFSFSFTDTEPGVTFQCQLDGGGFTTCTSPKAYSGLAQGAHTFQVKALDAAGNQSGVATDTWTIDATPPPRP
jgi:hypothetical protein